MAETVNFPAFIDIHVHCREPSTNHSETIESASMAALLGGIALMADMPNNPGWPTWTYERALQKVLIAKTSSHINFAVNAGSQPESDNIGEIEKMMRIAVLLKTYGGPTTGIERTTDYEASEFEPIVRELHRVAPEKPLLFHTGKDNLADMIDLTAKHYEHPMHVCHVNDPNQVDLVSQSRRNDLAVTCGACPHHILKTSHDEMTEGQFATMQPPLAVQADSEKLGRQLADAEIQLLESDHAPHPKEAKYKAEEKGGNCWGVPGIQDMVRLMLYQVKRGNLSMERLVDALSTQPARLLGLKLGGKTSTSWVLESGRIENEDYIASGADWTPYLGMQTGGRLLYMAIGGRTLFYDDFIYGRAGSQRVITDRGETL